MIRERIVLTVFTAASVIALSILAASSYYLYQFGIERKTQAVVSQNMRFIQTVQNNEQRRVSSVMAVSDTSQTEAVRTDAAPTDNNSSGWVQSQPYETWTVTSKDGLKLTAYYVPARIDTNRTVVLAHGYGGQAMEMGEFAKFYSEQRGFNVLLPDARGHAGSEGDYIGFGWPERLDYLQWIQEVINRVGPDAQIALHGLSMGGATVMMAGGEPLPQQVKVIVEDSGYTSVYEELAYQLKSMYNLPAFPLISATSLLTDIRAGYNFAEASALQQVAKNKTPMLFIHGAADTFVPTDMVYRLYDACQAEKQLYLALGAGHGMAYYVDKIEYEKIVADFIDRYIENPELRF